LNIWCQDWQGLGEEHVGSIEMPSAYFAQDAESGDITAIRVRGGGGALSIFIALAGFRCVLLGKADVPKWKCFDDPIWVDRAISHWVHHSDGQWMSNYTQAMPFGMKCLGDWAGGWVLRVARVKGSRW